jgi:hypothetical protein
MNEIDNNPITICDEMGNPLVYNITNNIVETAVAVASILPEEQQQWFVGYEEAVESDCNLKHMLYAIAERKLRLV